MSVEAIAAVSAQLAAPSAPAAAPVLDASALAQATDLLAASPNANAADGVFDRLVSSLSEIDARMKTNASAATDLALGQADNLHQVMIGAERTRLQFELVMSMRNRVLEAYQEIMRMQV